MRLRPATFRSRLQAGALAPILIATLLILGWWAVLSTVEVSPAGLVYTTILEAAGGIAALLFSAWLFRRGTRLAARVDYLMHLVPASDGRAPPTTGDELDLLQSAMQEFRELAARSEDISRRYQEVSRTAEELQLTSRRAEQVAESLRHNEVRVAECLERLARAERAMSHRTRVALLGHLFAGVCRDFSERVETILASSHAPDGAERLTAATREWVRRMKLYAGLDNNRAFKPTPFRVRDLLDDAVLAAEPRWRGEAQANGVEYRIAISCAPEFIILMDRQDLLEMLLHILDNAVEAMPLGGSIVLEAARAQAGTVLLSVTDHGEGMSDELLGACRQPFISTREGSAGLGLAIVDTLAKRNNVRFGLSSGRGQGTTVMFELPAAAQIQVARAPAPVPQMRPMSVLVVDDYALTAELIAAMLQPDGHVVDTCIDAGQAMERLTRRRYDVLITDRAMPGLSGIELARQVKEHYPRLPIIMLTGFAEMMIQSGDKPPGVSHLIGKPIRRDELMAALAATAQSPALAARPA